MMRSLGGCHSNTLKVLKKMIRPKPHTAAYIINKTHHVLEIRKSVRHDERHSFWTDLMQRVLSDDMAEVAAIVNHAYAHLQQGHDESGGPSSHHGLPKTLRPQILRPSDLRTY
jgi:hypothetical protein